MSPRPLRSAGEIHRLYPPRASRAVSPRNLDHLKGFVAQYKYNDIRTLILLSPGHGIELMTRKRQPLAEYTLTPAMKRALFRLELDASKHHVLDGGVMRHLVVKKEQPIVIWDILVHDDCYLVGSTYRERYALLRSICGEPGKSEQVTGHGIGLVISGNLWLAPTFGGDFGKLFRLAARVQWLEGLVLKDPGGRLAPALSEENNTSWQLKARKSGAAYAF